MKVGLQSMVTIDKERGRRESRGEKKRKEKSGNVCRRKESDRKKKIVENFGGVCWVLLCLPVEKLVTQNIQAQQTMSKLHQGNHQIILIQAIWILLGLLLLPAPTSADASQEFENLQNEFTEWKMAKYPYHFKHLRPSNKFNSYSLKGYEEEKDKINDFLNKLKKISRKKLKASDVFLFDLMKQMLEQKFYGYKWHLYGALNPLSFLENVATPKTFIATKTDYDEDGIINLLKLIGDIKRLLEDYKALMRTAIKNGHTLHNVSVIPVYKKLLNLSQPKDDIYSMEDLNKYITQLNVSKDRKNDLKSLANETMTQLREAYESMAQFLKDEYLPNTRPHIPISSLPNGRQLYDDYLKWHLNSPMSADDLHNLGHSEIKRIHGRMKKIMDKQKFNGTIKEYFNSLSTRPEFFLKTKVDIINRYKSLIKKIKDKLVTTFRDYPDLPLDILPMSTDGPLAKYVDGRESGRKHGSFILNLHRPQQMPTYQMMALALHEAIPGHHFQRSYSIISDLPLWKSHTIIEDYFLIPFQFPFNTAYIEGWGLYSEYLGEEMGLYETDYDLMGRYSFEIFRASRLVVDTGIHVKNMTREEAIEILMKNTGLSLANAQIEVDRYITMPGQACSYKIGEIKILQLRQKAEKALGPSFDVRDFHDTILKTGSIPLEFLERRIDEMIANNSATMNFTHLTLIYQFLFFILFKSFC